MERITRNSPEDLARRERSAIAKLNWQSADELLVFLRKPRRVFCADSLLEAIVAANSNKKGSDKWKQMEAARALNKVNFIQYPENLHGLLQIGEVDSLTPEMLKGNVHFCNHKVSVSSYLILAHIYEAGELNYLTHGYLQGTLQKFKDKGWLRFTKPRHIAFVKDFKFPAPTKIEDFVCEDILQECMDNLARRSLHGLE